jgi:hypothetical protein
MGLGGWIQEKNPQHLFQGPLAPYCSRHAAVAGITIRRAVPEAHPWCQVWVLTLYPGVRNVAEPKAMQAACMSL